MAEGTHCASDWQPVSMRLSLPPPGSTLPSATPQRRTQLLLHSNTPQQSERCSKQAGGASAAAAAAAPAAAAAATSPEALNEKMRRQELQLRRQREEQGMWCAAVEILLAQRTGQQAHQAQQGRGGPGGAGAAGTAAEGLKRRRQEQADDLAILQAAWGGWQRRCSGQQGGCGAELPLLPLPLPGDPLQQQQQWRQPARAGRLPPHSAAAMHGWGQTLFPEPAPSSSSSLLSSACLAPASLAASLCASQASLLQQPEAALSPKWLPTDEVADLLHCGPELGLTSALPSPCGRPDQQQQPAASQLLGFLCSVLDPLPPLPQPLPLPPSIDPCPSLLIKAEDSEGSQETLLPLPLSLPPPLPLPAQLPAPGQGDAGATPCSQRSRRQRQQQLQRTSGCQPTRLEASFAAVAAGAAGAGTPSPPACLERSGGGHAVTALPQLQASLLTPLPPPPFPTPAFDELTALHAQRAEQGKHAGGACDHMLTWLMQQYQE